MIEIEFDPEKNTRNQAEHGLRFEKVQHLDWDNALVIEDDRQDYGETRYRAFVYGKDDKPYGVAFTLRDNIVRVISFRRAREKERRLYDDKQRMD